MAAKRHRLVGGKKYVKWPIKVEVFVKVWRKLRGN